MPEDQHHKDIIDGCVLNHRWAQEQLYRRFFEAMKSLCIRYTKNPEDAMEVLQDGFLKVFKNISRYNPSVAGLYTWIRSVMVHAAIDFIRKRDHFCDYYEPGQIPETAISNEVIEKTDAHELLRLIRLLPPATQTVFNLHIIDGFQHHEIARMTGISEGTSKWHVSEARRMLKKWICLQQSQV